LVSDGALQSSVCFAIMGHVLQFMVKSEVDNDVEAKFLKTINGGLSLCGNERNLLGDSRLVAAAQQVGATAHEKFKVLPYRVKIQV
jgi:hypothetical protein